MGGSSGAVAAVGAEAGSPGDTGVDLFVDLFAQSGASAFDRACAVLRQFGFLRRSGARWRVGVVHQMVQRAVRNHLIMAAPGDVTAPAGWGLSLVETLESVLMVTYEYDSDKRWNQTNVARVQRLSPCVERWCTVFWGLEGHAKFGRHMDMSSHLHAACILRQRLDTLH